jgi:hypothetical protein
MFGEPIPYEYDVHGRDFAIRTELGGGATYTGGFSADGNTASGGWRPDPGLEGPVTSPTTSSGSASPKPRRPFRSGPRSR